ncbi:MAG: hypothetical protein ACLQQB_01385 [Solirubrobacteraceae bacterium]
MSVSSEVRRTLVKSPPELWAELSDPTALGRHLGELGEIRITGTDPERLVDWEATGTDGTGVSGRVEIEPSGWGTRVTLSASRAVAELEPATTPEQASEPGPGEHEPEAEAEVATIQAIEPERMPGPDSEPEAIVPETEPEPEPDPIEVAPEAIETTQPEPRIGFFARLFRRRKQQPAPEPVAELEPELANESEAATESEPVAVTEIEEPMSVEAVAETPAPEEPASEEPAPEMDISAELAELEQRTEAVLTGVLDRLGAAHHRPFSRA